MILFGILLHSLHLFLISVPKWSKYGLRNLLNPSWKRRIQRCGFSFSPIKMDLEINTYSKKLVLLGDDHCKAYNPFGRFIMKGNFFETETKKGNPKLAMVFCTHCWRNC